jgi:hypothetical protein
MRSGLINDMNRGNMLSRVSLHLIRKSDFNIELQRAAFAGILMII